MQNLNDLINPRLNIQLFRANDINERGEIPSAGLRGQRTAYVSAHANHTRTRYERRDNAILLHAYSVSLIPDIAPAGHRQ